MISEHVPIILIVRFAAVPVQSVLWYDGKLALCKHALRVIPSIYTKIINIYHSV